MRRAIDIATITGLALGAGIIASALFLSGVDLRQFYQPEAVLIVFGGTLTALLLQYSYSALFDAFKSVRQILSNEKLDAAIIANYLFEAAVFIREEGFLALAPLLEQVEIPFLREGFQLLIDNASEETICNQLTTRMDMAYQQDMQRVKVYESAAGFAPTMGVLGAVMGLVQTLGHFSSGPESLGQGVASAFIATLLGVGFANLLLHPVAGKLLERAEQARYLKSIMLIGLIGLHRGENPARVFETLNAYRLPSARWDDMKTPEKDWNSVLERADSDELGYAANTSVGRVW